MRARQDFVTNVTGCKKYFNFKSSLKITEGIRNLFIYSVWALNVCIYIFPGVKMFFFLLIALIYNRGYKKYS